MRTPGGEPLLLPEAVAFWTEHSDRCGVDSCLAALGVGADLRGFVGRWGVRSSTDTYVRTAYREVENLQKLAAQAGLHRAHARASPRRRPQLLSQLGHSHLVDHRLGNQYYIDK